MYTPRINYDPITRRCIAVITDGNVTMPVGSFENYLAADLACYRAIVKHNTGGELTPARARLALEGLRIATDPTSGAHVVVDGLGWRWSGHCFDRADAETAYADAQNELQRIIDGVTA